MGAKSEGDMRSATAGGSEQRTTDPIKDKIVATVFLGEL